MIRDAIAENDFNILPPSLVTSTKTKQKGEKKHFFSVFCVIAKMNTVAIKPHLEASHLEKGWLVIFAHCKAEVACAMRRAISLCRMRLVIHAVQALFLWGGAST